MDFLKLIRSFEDLLFELLCWLIYYPRTLWLVVRHPLRMIDYSNHEQTDADEDQYTDTLSPPLLLLITLALLHALELGLNTQHIQAHNAVGAMVVGSDQNLILWQSFVYGLLPLFAALHVVRRKGQPLERKYLRPPFFGQCYLVSAYALMVAISTMTAQHIGAWKWALGLSGAGFATLWYLWVQSMLFRTMLAMRPLRAWGGAIMVFVAAFLTAILVSLLTIGR